MPAEQGDWKSKSFWLSQNSLRSILSSSHSWRLHYQLAMANYVLPSQVIKLYTMMSVVDCLALFWGKRCPGAGVVCGDSCMQSEDGDWQEFALTTDFTCSASFGGGHCRCVVQNSTEWSLNPPLVSEVHTFSSGFMLCLALYLLLASYSSIHTSGFRMSSFIYSHFQIWLVMMVPF